MDPTGKGDQPTNPPETAKPGDGSYEGKGDRTTPEEAWKTGR